MKAILVAPYFSPRIGGLESYSLHVALNLRDLGWDIVIVSTRQPAEELPEEVAGLPIYYLRSRATFSNTPIGLGWRRQLRKIFEAERPDVINGHTPVPYLADMAERARGRIPYVLTYHSDLHKDSFPYNLAARLANLALTVPTLRRCTSIIATSHYYVKESRYLRSFAPKIHAVPPGVDLARLHPGVTPDASLAERYRGKQVILFVGSLKKSHDHKGLDILIKAFAQIRADHRGARLVVVGGGDGLPAFQELASREGVTAEVDFAGRVTDEALAQYYKLASVFAMPSTNRSEGFGMVFAEAGAVGVPVVGTRVGGVPYAIDDGKTGLLVQPGSVGALAGALETLLSDPDLAARLGKAGAARAAAESDWRDLACRTAKVLQQACAPGAPGVM